MTTPPPYVLLAICVECGAPVEPGDLCSYECSRDNMSGRQDHICRYELSANQLDAWGKRERE